MRDNKDQNASDDALGLIVLLLDIYKSLLFERDLSQVLSLRARAGHDRENTILCHSAV